jgi:FMN phosphatase YigB (HAD superfamily)
VLKEETVFLFDVDNTLLDNDRFGADLGRTLEQAFGAAERDRYWRIFADLRTQYGFADYLGSMQAFRTGLEAEPRLLELSAYMLEYPFGSLLFPGALAAIDHVRTFGRPVVLSDGDVIFQPRKIHHAGIFEAVNGAMLIYLHKEKSLDDVQRRYPASHYVMVDDKPNLLAAMKNVLRDKLTTVFVRQGHYALAPESNTVNPAPDRVIERIGDLLTLNPSDFEVTA